MEKLYPTNGRFAAQFAEDRLERLEADRERRLAADPAADFSIADRDGGYPS